MYDPTPTPCPRSSVCLRCLTLPRSGDGCCCWRVQQINPLPASDGSTLTQDRQIDPRSLRCDEAGWRAIRGSRSRLTSDFERRRIGGRSDTADRVVGARPPTRSMVHLPCGAADSPRSYRVRSTNSCFLASFQPDTAWRYPVTRDNWSTV